MGHSPRCLPRRSLPNHVRRPALQLQRGGPVGHSAHVNDGQLEGLADLLRCQTDTGGGMHRLKHVRDELADGRGDLSDARTFLPQHRISVFKNRQDHPAEESKVRGEASRGDLLPPSREGVISP